MVVYVELKKETAFLLISHSINYQSTKKACQVGSLRLKNKKWIGECLSGQTLKILLLSPQSNNRYRKVMYEHD